MKKTKLFVSLALVLPMFQVGILYAAEETTPPSSQPTVAEETPACAPIAPDIPEPVAVEEATTGSPSIVFEETEHDFGDVEKQSTVKHIFKFKNHGDALLVIDKVRATCGCTGTLLSEKEIPAGGEGTLEITFKSGLSGGKKAKSVYVNSNDPKQPSAQLRIKANVIVPVEVKPRSLYWVVEKDKSSKRLVQLVHRPEIKINITDLKLSSSAFGATVTPAEGTELPTYNIEITCGGDLPRGDFRENLTVHTDNPDYPTMNITLRGSVVGAVRVTPNAVALGVIKDGVIPSRIIRVFAVNKNDFEITALEPTDPLINADMSKEKDNNRYSINVTLKEPPPVGAFSGKLIIKTNVPEEDAIEVPVYAYVR